MRRSSSATTTPSTSSTTSTATTSAVLRRMAWRVFLFVGCLCSILAVFHLHSKSFYDVELASTMETQFNTQFVLPLIASSSSNHSSSSSSLSSSSPSLQALPLLVSSPSQNQNNSNQQPKNVSDHPNKGDASLLSSSSLRRREYNTDSVSADKESSVSKSPTSLVNTFSSESSSSSSPSSPFSNSSSSSLSNSFWHGLQQPFLHHIFPQWLQNYITWHYEMRQRYPGTALWTHPDAPNILLRYCVHKCGGLQDRLGNIPTDLYLAYQTKRILMISWYHPFALEDFVEPHHHHHHHHQHDYDYNPPIENSNNNGDGSSSNSSTRARRQVPPFLNWSLPHNAPNLTTKKMVLKFHKDLFHRNPKFNITLAIQQATVGEMRDEKVLLTRHLGCLHEEALERRLQHDFGMDTDTLHHTPTFGKVFHALFRPSASLAMRLQDVTSRLRLVPYHYAAVHCRVRHPGGYRYGKVIIGKLDANGKVVGSADQVGLDFQGEIRRHAISIATHAVQCTTTMLKHMLLLTESQLVNPSLKHRQQQQQQQAVAVEDDLDYPIYFLADSDELVNYMVHHVSNDTAMAPILRETQNGNVMDSDNETIRTEFEAYRVSSQTRLLSRPLIHPSVHLDRQKNVSLEAVQDVFVDLYLAMGAHCMSFGIGNFGYFATKLSYYARTCRWQYQLTVAGKSNDFLKRNLTNLLPTSVCTKDTLPQLHESLSLLHKQTRRLNSSSM